MASQPVDDDECIEYHNPRSAASKLFDLRILIGGLFSLYGIVLIIAGFFTSATARAKAAGVNINLWLGLSMLGLGILFTLWFRLRPLHVGGTSAMAQAEGDAPPPGAH